MTINSDEIALNQTWKKADVITFIAFLCNELPCNCRFAARVQRKSFLKLAFTSPDVIATSPKSFSLSRIDFTLLLLFEFLKEHDLPVGQVKNRFH